MAAKDPKGVKQKSGLDLRAEAEAKYAGRVVVEKTPRQQLDEHKETVRRGMRGFVEVGTALGLIAKQKLYKEDGYATFDEFVAAEFEVSRAWAYRAIDAARVITQMSQVETNASSIVNQAQALELAPIVKSVEAMARVVEVAKARGPLTADLLKAVRIELFPNPKVIDGEVVDERPAIEAVLPASGPSASPSVDGPDVTLDVVHLVSQFRPQTAPECAVGDGKTIGGASRTTCPACLAWLAGRDGWKWVHGASKAYPGDPACERCGRELDEGIVKAAQTRCITCDPDRLHYAVEAGGACEPCAALGLETAALVAEMGAAEDSAAAPSEAASAPAGQPLVPDVPEVVPMVATDQPGIDHPLVGEAPTPASSVAGVEPSPEAGVLTGGDEVEGEAGPSSSTDPDEPFADAAWTFMDGWRAFVRQVAGVDVEAVGPMLREDEFTELYGDLELLREQVKKLQRHA
jgi:hypothetical protein